MYSFLLNSTHEIAGLDNIARAEPSEKMLTKAFLNTVILL
jgi:hypothetical protein